MEAVCPRDKEAKLASEVAPVDLFESGMDVGEIYVVSECQRGVFRAYFRAFTDLWGTEPVENDSPRLFMAVWPKNAEQSFARRRRLKSMTSESECNNEVTGPQADVSGMYPKKCPPGGQQSEVPCAQTDRVFLPYEYEANLFESAATRGLGLSAPCASIIVSLFDTAAVNGSIASANPGI